MHKYYDFKNNNVYISNTTYRPFFIHGPDGQDFSIILNNLNYKCDNTIAQQLRKDTANTKTKILYFKLLNFKNKNIHNIYVITIIIIIIIIFFVIRSYL